MADEVYYKKRWEGKPFSFKLKYMYANYPGISLSCFVFLFAPIVTGAYYYYNYEGSRADAFRKYKIDYVVVRDDDPRVNEIIAEREKGRQHFPKC